MNKSNEIPLKTIIIFYLLMGLVSWILIRIFISPEPSQFWWGTAFARDHLLWGAGGALLLMLPIYLYMHFRPRQILQGLKPLLFLCHHPLAVLLTISLLAGVGEELLFRGFIQQFVGIWWTAIIFLLPHLSFPLMLKQTLDRILLTIFYLVAGLLLGLLAREVGLIAAIMAHTIYDFGIFSLIKQKFIAS